VGAGGSGGDSGCRLVLADVTGIEPRRDDALDPGGGDQRNIVRRQDTPFLQHCRAEPQAMRQNGARRFAYRDFTEFH
jgi:hypothetical protein